MVERKCSFFIEVEISECRALDRGVDSKASCEALYERCLSGAKISRESEDRVRLHQVR
jgi:hypothetical protein